MDTIQLNTLREYLIKLLSGKWAHLEFQAAVAEFPARIRGTKAKGLPYTAWQLLEHMRIAQWDILEFSRNPGHVSPEWPAGYWPTTETPPDDSAWDKSVKTFIADLEAMKELVKHPDTDLFAKIAHGSGQTILREAMLLADHNAYHLGQLVLVRKTLGDG